MAFYVYECESCGAEIRERRNMSEKTGIDTCPDCGGKCWQHIFPSAIKFNGSGFYVNDYKAKTNNLTTSEKS
jgi:putative FmdB family regulatory protein